MTLGRRLRWVGLAFVPSSLMLGVTMHLSTDIAAVPLLWVLPLALYLLSFILVFAKRPPLPHRWVTRALPLAVVVSALLFCLGTGQVIWIPFHLLTVFVVALAGHGELVNDRPSPYHLTEFYLWMSIGGALGGLFNAVIAPVLFDRVIEYPLALVLAALLRRSAATPGRKLVNWYLDFVLPLGLGALAALLFTSLPAGGLSIAQNFVVAGLIVLCYTVEARPIGFALGVGGVLLASGLAPSPHGRIVHQERTFFGVLRVAYDPEGNYNQLLHGSTIHGRQSLDPAHRREPLTYYHRTGPIGQVFEVFEKKAAEPSVAIIGLGAGSLACYARPNQRWTFYEIDPAVERIARNPHFFTYLQDCRAGELRVVLGDARLRLREEPDQHYGLIILDAFSSDAIPVHLLTKEALRLYLDKLAEGGMLAFHISNNYLDLKPVLDALARDSDLACWGRDDLHLTEIERQTGKTYSQWVVMARAEPALGHLVADPRWQPLPVTLNQDVWTDDYCNILGILRVR